MSSPEKIIEQFNFGLSVLDAYIRLCNKTRLFNINIVSENFFCKMLNILYDYNLKNANEEYSLTAGYDLYSDKEKLLVQVTSECTVEKITSCIDTIEKSISKINILEKQIKDLEIESKTNKLKKEQLQLCTNEFDRLKDIRNHRIKFLFLTLDASKLRKNKKIQDLTTSQYLIFDPNKDIIDYSTLSNKVLNQAAFSEKESELLSFMSNNKDLFIKKILKKNRVQHIISEYSNNFEGKLFLHKYEDCNVILRNMYVEPSFVEVGKEENCFSDIAELLCDFLWQKPKNDKERILFIEGDAAIGKTSLISWLCYHYLENDQTLESNIGKAIFMNRKIVCVRLRELNFSNQQINPTEVILKHLNFDNMESFEEEYTKSIIILDGADELSMVSGIAASSIENFILDVRKNFSNHKIIITTRPKFLNMKIFDKTTFKIRRITLEHFNYDMRMEWIKKYKECGETIPESTELYIKSLSDEAAIGVADTPLALYLLARCDMRKELQGNDWALFHEIFFKAIVDAEYNENFENSTNDLKHRKSHTNYLIVEKIAYKMFQNSKEERYYIKDYEIDEIIKSVINNKHNYETVRQTCVLCAYWKNSNKIGALEFYHNNIRDFFMCEYIYDSLYSCIKNSSTSQLAQTIILEFCRIFSWGEIVGTTWEQAFSFLYLRLKYEYEYSTSDNTLCNLISNNNLFSSILYTMLKSKTFWSYDYEDLSYISAKHTFCNVMMLLRILHDFIPECDINKKISLWHSEFEKSQWERSNIIKDWYEVLKKSVNVSKNFQIGIASKTNLENIKLQRLDLNNINFQECNFENASFTKSSLIGAIFIGAKLKNVDFSYAELNNANFTGATLDGVNFSKAKIIGAMFNGATIVNCVWNGCTFDKNDFSDAYINNIEIKGKKLERINFNNSKVENSKIKNCKISEISISKKSSFIHTDFSKTEFGGVIDDAIFKKCIFDNCYFNYLTKLSESFFDTCSCNNACFNNLILDRINFTNTDLRNLECVGTIFNSSYIKGNQTQIDGSNFTKAHSINSDFSEVNFYRVHLRDSIGFEKCVRFNPYLSNKK